MLGLPEQYDLRVPAHQLADGHVLPQPVGATRRFTVAAGSTTVFYLNSKAFVDVGEGITLMGYSSMTATFTPD
ncbi:MAG: hypothetical protein V9G12_08415 [Microthrixaceae bacterium]